MRRAELLTELGRFLATFDSLAGEAERHIRAALELEPRNANALVALAQLRMREKKYDAAETLFATAVSAEPENAEAILAFAEGLLRDEIGPFAETNAIGVHDIERFHRARTLAERAMQLGADPGRAWGAIGITYLGDSDRAPGIAALQKAHELLPARADYALHLAALLRRSGRAAESDAILGQLDAMHDPQVSFAARAIVVALELDRINNLIRDQKLDDAVPAIQALIAKTDDPRAKAELERQLRSLEAVRRTNAEIRAYNAAIAVSNTGRTRDAIKLLDELLATAHDPHVIDDARELRARLAKRR